MTIDDIKVQNIEKLINVSFDNAVTMIGSYSLGDNEAKATYKITKGLKKIAIFFDEIPDDASEQTINEYLSKYKIIVIKK